MSDGVFNISKGAFVEKIRDATTDVLVLLLKLNEAEATLIDRTTVALMLAEGGTTEADFTNYAREYNLSGASITVDNTNDRVDVDIDDITWSSAGGATNNDIKKLILAFEESAADSGRIPMTHHDFVTTTDGNDIVAQINSAGFGRAE